MDTIDVDGLEIAYERTGSGPPLLLLHGALSDGRMWRQQLDGLSDEFTVIAWDAPGCGKSSDPPDVFPMREYANCLAMFVHALGLDSPHVLGLSWGGGLALALYGHHPTVPRSLILTAAYAGWAGSLSQEETERRLQRGLRESEMPPEEVVPGWIPGLLTRNAPPELVDEVKTIMVDFHPAGTRTMARAFAEADLRYVLPLIDVPTLLLYGEEDVRSPRAVAENLHTAISGSELVFLPGVGHLSNMEAPDLFNDSVRAFLRSTGA